MSAKLSTCTGVLIYYTYSKNYYFKNAGFKLSDFFYLDTFGYLLSRYIFNELSFILCYLIVNNFKVTFVQH